MKQTRRAATDQRDETAISWHTTSRTANALTASVRIVGLRPVEWLFRCRRTVRIVGIWHGWLWADWSRAAPFRIERAGQRRASARRWRLLVCDLRPDLYRIQAGLFEPVAHSRAVGSDASSRRAKLRRDPSECDRTDGQS